MGSRDPDTRANQFARLRAAYEARPGRPRPDAPCNSAHHSRALLGRILVVLGGLQDGAGVTSNGPDGKTRARP
ncbi:hypothetical protein [Methylobacterium sp. P5_C11]